MRHLEDAAGLTPRVASPEGWGRHLKIAGAAGAPSRPTEESDAPSPNAPAGRGRRHGRGLRPGARAGGRGPCRSPVRPAHQAQHHAGQEPAQLRRRRSRRARQQHHHQPERAHRRRPWPAEHRRGPDRRLPRGHRDRWRHPPVREGHLAGARQRRQDREQRGHQQLRRGHLHQRDECPPADPGQPDQLERHPAPRGRRGRDRRPRRRGARPSPTRSGTATTTAST